MKIPFLDLRYQNDIVRNKVLDKWNQCIDANEFILGSDVNQFEHDYSSYTGNRFVVSVGNGTDALEIALRAVGVSSGDEVIVPDFTFAGTALAVSRIGANIVPADVRLDSATIDSDIVIEKISDKTKAVIGVNLFGQMCEIEKLRVICDAHGLAFVEDGAQSHGARRNGKMHGNVSDVAAVSFYPSKNLGAWGDGGAIVTNDEKIYEKALKLRNYGGKTKYDHSELGFNSRLDTLQAIVLREKLKWLDNWNTARSEIASIYSRHFSSEANCVSPVIMESNVHSWHLYVIQMDNRHAVTKRLESSQIGTGIHYPAPIHRLEVYKEKKYSDDEFPNSSKCANRVLSLPIYPGLSPAVAKYVATKVLEATSLFH